MLPCNGNINAMPRKVSCKLVINGNTITGVKLLRYSTDWSGDLSIGNVISAYFNCTLPTPSFSISGQNVTLSMGIGDPVEWVTIGTFKIDEKSIHERQGYTTFSAYDKLYSSVNTYHSALTFPTTLQAICNEVCTAIGITSVNLPVTATISEDILDGYTLRDVLGFVAAYCGKNAYLSPSGVLDLRYFSASTYTADGTRANIPYIANSDSTVSRLICQSQDGVLTAGSGEGIYFTCPFMTQTRLNALLSSLSMTYRQANVDIPYGNFCIQSGDIITVTTTGTSLTVPIMENSWNYDGGLSSEVVSYGVSDYTGSANNAYTTMSSMRVKNIMESKRAANQVTAAIQEATDTITGATGGVVRINMGQNGLPGEILILSNDIPGLTPTIQNATRVFRLNENGLGYSQGPGAYSGPYETAITADGLIVTDRFVGNTISGVTLETIAAGTGSRPKVIIENGALEVKRVASDDVVHNIGYIKYVPRGDYDEYDTMAARVDLGKVFAIGYDNNGGHNDQFIYYSDLNNAPDGAATFNIWGSIKIWSDYARNMISLQDTLQDLQDQIDDLKQRVTNLE